MLADAGLPLPNFPDIAMGANPIAVLMIGLAIAAVVFKLARRTTSGCVIPFVLAGMVVLATLFISINELVNLEAEQHRQRKHDQERIERRIQELTPPAGSSDL